MLCLKTSAIQIEVLELTNKMIKMSLWLNISLDIFNRSEQKNDELLITFFSKKRKWYIYPFYQ